MSKLKYQIEKISAEENLESLDSGYEDYLEGLDPKIRGRILRQNARYQNGLHTVAPMMCPGPDRCKILEHCPIPERDGQKVELGPKELYPMGRQCVVEKLYMHTRVVQLVHHLGVDESNPIELAIVSELAMIDLYKQRAAMFLGKGDLDGQGLDFMRVDTKGFDENGNPVTEAKLHPITEMLDRLEKRRERWLDRLMETRKAKYESSRGQPLDNKLMGEIEQLREAIQQMNQAPELIQVQEGERLMLDGHEDKD